MGLPPTHRVDHTPTVVLSFDTAWDMERVNAESAALPNGAVHPWVLFHTHKSRADLETVRAYLLADPPSPPLVFELRRLSMKEMTVIETRETTNGPAARNLALSLALQGVEGHEFEFKRGQREPHALTDADLEQLRAVVGDDGIRELGNHAVACSRMELTEPEKKP